MRTQGRAKLQIFEILLLLILLLPKLFGCRIAFSFSRYIQILSNLYQLLHTRNVSAYIHYVIKEDVQGKKEPIVDMKKMNLLFTPLKPRTSSDCRAIVHPAFCAREWMHTSNKAKFALSLCSLDFVKKNRKHKS
jgi:hypothetical protein